MKYYCARFVRKLLFCLGIGIEWEENELEQHVLSNLYSITEFWFLLCIRELQKLSCTFSTIASMMTSVHVSHE